MFSRAVSESNRGPSLFRSAPSSTRWTTLWLLSNATCDSFEPHRSGSGTRPRTVLISLLATTTWCPYWFTSNSTAELLTSPIMKPTYSPAGSFRPFVTSQWLPPTPPRGVFQAVGAQPVAAGELARSEVETLAALAVILAEQPGQLIALLSGVRSHRERREAINVQPAHTIHRRVEHLQRRCLQQQTVVHMQIARAILQFACGRLQITAALVHTTTAHRRATAAGLLALGHVADGLRRIQMIVHPLLAHTRNLLEHDRTHARTQLHRDTVDTPERGEVIMCGIVVEVPEHTGVAVVDLKVVAAEEVLLARLQGQQMRVLAERTAQTTSRTPCIRSPPRPHLRQNLVVRFFFDLRDRLLRTNGHRKTPQIKIS